MCAECIGWWSSKKQDFKSVKSGWQLGWLNCVNTPAVTRAKQSILKAYSYESPLYKAINRANEYQDKKAI